MAALTALTGSSALAAVATYNGTSTLFSTGFTGGSAAGEPATGDSLLFGTGTAGTTLTDDLLTPGAYSLAGITFNSAALAYTINPATVGTNGFTLASAASGGTGITNNSTNLETINDLITLSGVQTFTTTAGGGNLTLGGVVSGTGSGITTAGGGTLTLSAANTFTGLTTIASGTTLVASNAGSLGTSANTAGVAISGTLNLSTAGTAYTFGGPVTGSGTINATVSGGSNTTKFGSVNSLSGFTGVINVLEAGSGGKLELDQSPSAASAINVASGATLFMNTSPTTAAAISLGGGATGETYGQLRTGQNSTFNGPITLTGTVTGTNNSTITVFGNTDTINGAIGQTGGAQSLLLGGSGSGTVILTTTNTYTGSTTVGVGTGGNNIVNLRVNGSIGSTAVPAGAVTVNSGSVLSGAGNGTTTGILTVASATFNTGSFLTPGATTGATTGALTLNTTSGLTLSGTLSIGIAGASSTSLVTSGLLTLSGATLTTTGTLNGTSAYDIANYGTLAGTFTNYTPPTGYSINYAGSTFGAHDIELDVTAVPEPSTWVGAILTVLGAVGIQLRRKQRAV